MPNRVARPRWIVAAIATSVVLAACSVGTGVRGDRLVEPTQRAVPVPVTTPNVPRNEPWPQRPVVSLRFEIGADRAAMAGSERVVFTPDARICELVFRAWPNKPETARAGNSLVVTAARVDGQPVTPSVAAAGAPAGHPGTLITLPLPACVSAETPVTADLDFQLRLGPDTDERVGWSTEDGTAWFGSAFPLLAWVRGSGWATDPAVDLFGETTVSEDFRLETLEVVAPAADEVFGIGRRLSVEPGPRPGTRLHTFAAEAVRDVTVTVGKLEVVEVDAAGTKVYVGVPAAGTSVPIGQWAKSAKASVERLSRLLGPYPYEGLWASVDPDIDGGVEFPGAIQFGDVNREILDYLVAHEVAHMWFYGLVGNNQARDPWLDEAFAEYASAVTMENEARYLGFSPPPSVEGQVGEPMQWYSRLGGRGYSAGVYAQGAQALLEAREAAGAERFDEAVRTYVDTNAWTIATPEDLEVALAGLPQAVGILRDAGALPAAN